MSSQLAFGCAPIMGRYGRHESLAILDAAFELGIRHFDVARSYGYGEAEGILGEFIKRKNENMTIATKFGVLPSRKAKLFSFAKPLVRPFIKKKTPTSDDMVFNNPNIIDEGMLTKSIEQSRKALQLDKVDMLFIHEPNPNWIIPSNLSDALNKLIQVGVISGWGVSGYFRSVDLLLKSNPSFNNKIQTSSNILVCQDVSELHNLYAVFSPFHRGFILNIIGSLIKNEEYSLKLSELIGFDVSEKAPSYLALYLMIPFTRQKIILSTSSTVKLESNIQAAFDAKDCSIIKAKSAISLIQEFKNNFYA